MPSAHPSYVVALRAALVAGIICCGSENGPLQPQQPTRLAFVARPSAAVGAQPITPAVQVAVQDASGHTVTAATDTVTVALGSRPGIARLHGTITMVTIQGIATFSDLRLDRPGRDYRLVATAPGLIEATSSPFADTLTFAQLSAGSAHTCGVTAQGDAYCWGYGGNGELGDSTYFGDRIPALVSGGLTFAAVGAGGPLTCGTTRAGTAYCWGHGGELGDGTTTSRSSPVLVSGGFTFAAVDVAGGHACGVTTGGTVYCWGTNADGELGDGTLTDQPSPVLVTGNLTFTTVSTGPYTTCGVTAGGAAYCWGRNDFGQLGDTTRLPFQTSPLLVTGGVSFTAVRAGVLHTCGITAAGTAYCWGNNDLGQLGDSNTVSRSAPGLVAGGVSFTDLSTTGLHTCGVTAAGVAYCWGSNSDGQLGDGTTTNRSSPTVVSGGLTFAVVRAGVRHTCGLTTVGAAYCWGSHSDGQLGTGYTTGSSLVPMRVVQ